MIVYGKNLNKKERKEFQKIYKKMYDLIDFSVNDLKSAMEEDIDNAFEILLYKIDKKIVGCIYVHEYDYYADTYFKNGCYFLSNLYVDEKYRKLGIASKMLLEVEKIARQNKVDTIISDYIDDNIKSSAWHNKNGFNILKRQIVVIKKISDT